MVQASWARKAELDYACEYPAGQARSPRKVRRVYRKYYPGRRTLMKAGLAAFVYAVILVCVCATVSTMGYQMVRLEKDVAELQDANHMLRLKIAQEVSLDRIETTAVKRLGMHRSDPGRTIAVAASTPHEVRTAERKTNGGDMKSEGVGERALHKLYRNLTLLVEQR